MKTNKNQLPKTTLRILLGLACALLLAGGIYVAQAELRIRSSLYDAAVATGNLGVQLYENGTTLVAEQKGGSASAAGELMLDFDDYVEPGMRYEEKLHVANSGGIDEYIRVSVYKYWQDKDGKRPDLDPSLIELEWNTKSGWIKDPASETKERTVLYYTSPVAPGGKTGTFLEAVTINGKVADIVTQTEEKTEGGTQIRTTFMYEGAEFHILTVVDAVQTHNAEDAVKSAWGTNVSIKDGMLSLKEG